MIKNNVVENNDLEGGGPLPGFPAVGPGNGIGVSNLANAGGATNMLVQGNQVHGNGLNGIYVSSTGNRILNNNAVGNSGFAAWFPGYDLAHESSFIVHGCLNVWNGNLWRDWILGFEQGCETAGGHPVSVPPPPAVAASAKVKSAQAKPAPVGSWSNPAPRGHPANPAR